MAKIDENFDRQEFLRKAQKEFYHMKGYPLPLDSDGTANSMSDKELVEWVNEKCYWREQWQKS